MQCSHKEAKLSGNSEFTNSIPKCSKGQTVKMPLKSNRCILLNPTDFYKLSISLKDQLLRYQCRNKIQLFKKEGVVTIVVQSVQTLNSQSNQPANYKAPDGFINLKVHKSFFTVSKKRKKNCFLCGIEENVCHGVSESPKP